MPSLLGGFRFVYGKLAAGEPRAVSLDSPGAGSYRRTATSGISLNYRHGTGCAAVREREPTAFGRPTLAGEQGETREGPSSSRYMASARTSGNSLNYGNDKGLDAYGKVEPIAFGWCPSGTGPRRTSEISLNYADRAKPANFGGPTPEGGRKPGVARLASAISLNYGTLSCGLEPGRLRPMGPTTFGRAKPAVKRPLLAEERGDARYAASAQTSENSLNYRNGPTSSCRMASVPASANSLNYGEPRERMEPATLGGAAPAVGRSFLAGKREEARHAASAPPSENSLNYGS